jgi:trans-2,3-dihydro-3-hydroxyanthranilate isomerase
MRKTPIYQVDAFTARPFAGNPAAVVPDARGLSEAEMQRIAREMNLSETAFVFPPADGRPHRFRWFTPAIEVEFCGHATLAATHVLATTGRLGALPGGRLEFPVDAKIGRLELAVEERAGRGPLIMIGVPISRFERVEATVLAPYLHALGVTGDDLDPDLPVSRYRWKIFLPLRRLERIRTLEPDFGALRQLGRQIGLAACPFTLETMEPASAVHLRFFAPAAGIDEDPVTGAANAPLGAYLAQHRQLTRRAAEGRVQQVGRSPDVWRYVAEQGDECGRPGRPVVEVTTAEDGQPRAVRVGGEAVTVLEGTLALE